MRPIARFTSYAIMAICTAALAATGASAAPAPAPTGRKIIDSEGYLRGGPAVLKLGNAGSGPAASGRDREIEVLSYSWGVSQAGQSRDTVMKGSKVGQNAKAGKKGNVEYTWKVEEGESAPPKPGGNSHEVEMTTVAAKSPPGKGTVWVRVATPWNACRVGTRYPSIQLNEGGKSYVLQDVTVSNCGRAGDADDRPTEEVAFYYNRIAFNYAR